jgi:hypothetical protein
MEMKQKYKEKKETYERGFLCVRWRNVDFGVIHQQMFFLYCLNYIHEEDKFKSKLYNRHLTDDYLTTFTVIFSWMVLYFLLLAKHTYLYVKHFWSIQYFFYLYLFVFKLVWKTLNKFSLNCTFWGNKTKYFANKIVSYFRKIDRNWMNPLSVVFHVRATD